MIVSMVATSMQSNSRSGHNYTRATATGELHKDLPMDLHHFLVNGTLICAITHAIHIDILRDSLVHRTFSHYLSSHQVYGIKI